MFLLDIYFASQKMTVSVLFFFSNYILVLPDIFFQLFRVLVSPVFL